MKFSVSETNDVAVDEDGNFVLVFKDGKLNRYLNEFEVSFIKNAMGYARADAWSKFIEELNRQRPLVFDKKKPPLPHVNFLGSIKEYEKIFMQAQRSSSSVG